MDEGFPKGLSRPEAAHEKEKKALKAYEMRVNGYSGKDIAIELDISRTYVYTLINEFVDREAVYRKELVQVEIDRLDVVIKLCMRDLERQEVTWVTDEDTGEKVPSQQDRIDNQVCATLFKAQERKAKFLGLDKPQEVKHDHEHTITIEDMILQSQPEPKVIDVEAKEKTDE